MKTTTICMIGGAIIVAGILISVHFSGGFPHQLQNEKNTEIAAITQSVDEESNIILCPMSEDIMNGQQPTFSYRTANDGHALQDTMTAITVVAGINNGNAICKYYNNQPTQIFSIILEGNYSSCSYENDPFVGFSCN